MAVSTAFGIAFWNPAFALVTLLVAADFDMGESSKWVVFVAEGTEGSHETD